MNDSVEYSLKDSHAQEAITLAVALAATLLPALAVPPGPETYKLQALPDAARASHPSLQAARAMVDAGRAQVTSAGAYPNPEVEFLSGRTQAQLSGVTNG